RAGPVPSPPEPERATAARPGVRGIRLPGRGVDPGGRSIQGMGPQGLGNLLGTVCGHDPQITDSNAKALTATRTTSESRPESRAIPARPGARRPIARAPTHSVADLGGACTLSGGGVPDNALTYRPVALAPLADGDCRHAGPSRKRVERGYGG